MLMKQNVNNDVTKDSPIVHTCACSYINVTWLCMYWHTIDTCKQTKTNYHFLIRRCEVLIFTLHKLSPSNFSKPYFTTARVSRQEIENTEV